MEHSRRHGKIINLLMCEFAFCPSPAHLRSHIFDRVTLSVLTVSAAFHLIIHRGRKGFHLPHMQLLEPGFLFRCIVLRSIHSLVAAFIFASNSASLAHASRPRTPSHPKHSSIIHTNNNKTIFIFPCQVH